MRISRLSQEAVWVPVAAEHPIDGPIDPTSNTVEVAFVHGEPDEDDWIDAAWEDDPLTINGQTYHLAVVTVGPGQAVELTEGMKFSWFRINGEVVVKGGFLTVY